jgi:hypothetical protein
VTVGVLHLHRIAPLGVVQDVLWPEPRPQVSGHGLHMGFKVRSMPILLLYFCNNPHSADIVCEELRGREDATGLEELPPD